MKLKLAFLWGWAVLVFGSSVPGEIYSSLAHVQRLFKFDHNVGQALLQLSTASPESLRYREMYMWALTDANFSSNDDHSKAIEALTGNPLHVFALMKRILSYWHFIYLDLTNAGILGKAQRWLNDTVFPTERDFIGTALALARLQQVYNLPIKDLANGMILHRHSSVRLTIFDCMRIANESYWEKNFINSWHWYFYAMRTTADLDLKLHVWVMMRQVARDHDQQRSPKLDTSFPLPLTQHPFQESPTLGYFNLCRGQQAVVRGAAFDRLKCHVSDRGVPYLRLQPVKYEELHYAPELYFYYDVVTNYQIQIIKDLATKKLTRATFKDDNAARESRITHTAWLRNETHPSLASLAKRISYITGLHVYEGDTGALAGEELQVQCYGVGGHYLLHYDPLYKIPPGNKLTEEPVYPETIVRDGDRLATLMIYMSNVEAGGRTVFGTAGISVNPVKGGAAFWYNIDRQGQLDPSSLHAGCPVLYGHKWAANKWIRENANFLRRPCDAITHNN